MYRSLALTLCLALATAGSTRAARGPPLFSCADLPTNWGNDEDSDDNNDNGPWADISTEPSSEVYAQIYSTFESRYSNAPFNAAWTACTTPEPSAIGCQQTAGQGMNYALQVNFTCTDAAGEDVTLGMTVDVNTYSQYINVDDMDVEFIAVNGEIVEGNIDESSWYEDNDDMWGNWYSFTQSNNNENNNNDDQDDDDQYINNQFAAAGQQIGASAAAIGETVGSGQISGEQAGEMFQAAGEAMG